ncbi:MAG: hypothetical protein JWQ29_2683 [Phenylobacterium sp.]|nr:hypothetical protein [Phenylobacterium sp.]
MLVRDAVKVRLAALAPADDQTGRARLPDRLKPDRIGVRAALLRRLGASRQFAAGDRAGVLRAAQARSGRPFAAHVVQRVIVKARVSRHTGVGAARGRALAAHVAYLGRSGAGVAGTRATFFDRSGEGLDGAAATAGWTEDRHHFRFIISPEHGERIADLRRYTREVVGRMAADLGEPGLAWIATCHFDTGQPHAHVLVRGRRANGRDLVIPRAYVAFGVRARAQETAQELLGDLSRGSAERRVWRETQADRFTGFDRRLLAAADAGGWLADGVGANGAWAALSRARLQHLETIGLAIRADGGFQLAPDLELRLRTLQLRQDVLRTLNQRRLETGREVRELAQPRVRGRVMSRGAHDELGAASWVVVRDRDGVEHYARLRFGQDAPSVGRAVELLAGDRGAVLVGRARGAERSL